MKVYRVINNNVVSILDDNKNEVILTGIGIAFQKKPGDDIDESLIDKRFFLEDSTINDKFKQLLKDIPISHVELASDIVEYAKISLDKNFNDSIYILLSDHIYMAIQRYLDGFQIKNPMLWEIQRFYEPEYEVGLKALEMIEERFKVTLPVDEAGFITIHLVDSQMDNTTIENFYEITKVIQDISNIVKYFFSIDFDTKSVYYYRFITHIRYFAQRFLTNTSIEENNEDSLYQIIKRNYKNAYECVLKIEDYIQKNFNIDISNEEKLYLMIHIERMVYKTKK